MVGAYKARVAPFNVNYRYVAEELRVPARPTPAARAIVFHSRLRPDAGRGPRPTCPHLQVLLQVADDSGNGLLPGAELVRGRARGRSARPCRTSSWPPGRPTTCTSSTRAAPPACPRACCGARPTSSWPPSAVGASDDRRGVGLDRRHRGQRRQRRAPACCPARRSCTAPRTGWRSTPSPTATPSCCRRVVDRLDPGRHAAPPSTREGVNIVLIVGDAFGRPLVEELEAGGYDLSSVLAIVSGGAALSAGVKERLLDALPSIMVLDGLGASETGPAGQPDHRRRPGRPPPATSPPVPGMCILSEDLTDGARAGPRGDGLAGPDGSGAARLPGRRGQDRPHLPGHRRRPLLGARRPGPA